MRIVFKIIAIIGVLSFLGGLKNGVFFFFGLILAGIFGYLGWRPESVKSEEKNKKKLNSVAKNHTKNVESPQESDEDKENERLNESALENEIEKINKNINLLFTSHDDGLLSKVEFADKLSVLEDEKEKLTNDLSFIRTRIRILKENKDLFIKLKDLKNAGLINSEEYFLKEDNLISNILSKEKSVLIETENMPILDRKTNSIKTAPRTVSTHNYNVKNISNEDKQIIRIIKVTLASILICGLIIYGYIHFYKSQNVEISEMQTKNESADNVQFIKTNLKDTFNSKTRKKNIDNSEENKESIKYGTVSDIDGNTYSTVTIGKQEWMAMNLNVSRFRNGDMIIEAKTIEDWIFCAENEIPAWCYFENNSYIGEINGKLYNLWAVIDPRGLAPMNWSIPKKEEVKILETKFGGFRKAGKHLKSKDFPGGGTNMSGFNAKFVGERRPNGEFSLSNQSQQFWTRTTGGGWGGRMNSISGEIIGIYLERDWGGHCGAALGISRFPVRCIKK